MDAPDGPNSPEWRPATSILGGVPSTSTSSVTWHPPTSIASTRTDARMAASSSSDYSSFIAAHGAMVSEDGRRIEPFETQACYMLTEEIRSFGLGGHDSSISLARPASFQSESLEIAMSKAATILRYNAKWFAPPALADLITEVLAATVDSSSSAVFHAALDFLDTVLVYSILPPKECLYPTVRFLARTYYSASRANKTKKLGSKCWSVGLHLLHSHLGHEFLFALHKILGAEDSTSKDGFGEVVGALMVVKELLRSREAQLPDIKVTLLVLQLKVAAGSGNTIVHEYVRDVLIQIMMEEDSMQQLHQDAGWRDFLETVVLCVADDPQDATAYELVNRLNHHLPQIQQEDLLYKVGDLFVMVGLPLHLPLFTAIWSRRSPSKPIQTWVQGLDYRLRGLLCDPLYADQVSDFVQSAISGFEMSSSDADKSALVQELVRCIEMDQATSHSKGVLTMALAYMFRIGLSDGDSPEILCTLFLALCQALRYSTEAASALYRIRKDVEGHLYLRLADHEPAFLEIADPLPLDAWFAAFTDILREGAATWEAYEWVLQATKILLGNHTMFSDSMPALREIMKVVKSAVDRSDYIEPPAHTALNKSHVAAELVQNLVAILSYHRQLTKQENLSLVALFDSTAGSRDYIVSTQCIHALTVCCYEVPDLMSSHMDGVINRMSRMVTQRYLAIHVLHFFAGLSRLPDLYRNFTVGDYMRIFGVCHSYLQSARGAHAAAERSQTPTSGQSSVPRMEEALPEYVYALAHHVITFWYMSLKSGDREKVKPYITGCLTYKDADDSVIIEDQGLVTLDMMDRIDAEPRPSDDSDQDDEDVETSAANMPDPFFAVDGRVIETHRLIGLLLVTTKLALRTGKALIIVRRPSGTAWRLLVKGIAQVTVDGGGGGGGGGDDDDDDDDDACSIPIWPGDSSGRTYGTIRIPRRASALGSKTVITLPQDDAVRRAIEAFDRTSALDSHKAGVVYVGERQTTEDRIFQNISGSPGYREFVKNLGALERLRGAAFNTQGLDRAEDTDGEFAIVWHNKVTEVVFHVTTMMPNSDDATTNTGRKKRHIGNNHVNIVYNNSGGMLDYETLYNIFPGQLTYVYIVITPSARTSFVEARTVGVTRDKREWFYAVQVVTRPDYPNVSPAVEEKVVSGASLPGFVRNLALNECIISLMWTPRNDSAEYPSSWRSRLHQLRRLGERYGEK